MSLSTEHPSRRNRRACQSCRIRNARFQRIGPGAAQRNDAVCLECFRAERHRRAALVAEPPPPEPPPPAQCSPSPPALAERQLAHRRRMLDVARAIRDGFSRLDLSAIDG